MINENSGVYVNIPSGSKWDAERRVNIVSGYECILQYSSTNGAVWPLQRRLNELGYLGKDGKMLSVDGKFGANTLFAVNAYKKANGLWNFGEYEGKVGLTTWQHMGMPGCPCPGTTKAQTQPVIVPMTTMPRATSANAPANTISPSLEEVLKYAKDEDKDKDDVKCAEFVSHCLAAGGIVIPDNFKFPDGNDNKNGLGTYYHDGKTFRLRSVCNNPHRCAPALLVYLTEICGYGYIKAPAGSSLQFESLSTGDVVFSINGSSHYSDGHTFIITYSDNNGNVRFSARNSAHTDEDLPPVKDQLSTIAPKFAVKIFEK